MTVGLLVAALWLAGMVVVLERRRRRRRNTVRRIELQRRLDRLTRGR